jgi:signal transduction histidine kinase
VGARGRLVEDRPQAAVVGHTVECQVTVTGVPRRPPAKVEKQVLRIGQNAISNAVRHASAAHILVALLFEPASLTLRVSDDGVGFSTATGSPGDER